MVNQKFQWYASECFRKTLNENGLGLSSVLLDKGRVFSPTFLVMYNPNWVTLEEMTHVERGGKGVAKHYRL